MTITSFNDCNNKILVKGYRDTGFDISFIKESVLPAVYLQNVGKLSKLSYLRGGFVI